MPAQKFVDKHSLKILNMEPSGIPTNNSHQHLMNGDDCDSVDAIVPPLSADGNDSSPHMIGGKQNHITGRDWLTVAVLCFVNLINYMDRYTIAGILTDLKSYFNIKDDKAGLLQTAFILSYMICAPIFGYLGDRYSRRAIMAFGVFIWSLTTLAGSFAQNYHLFLFFRTVVGLGEASYSTIAPTIISDLFVKDVRSKMLALFYFAIPVGSGLGYIIGSLMRDATGVWQWGLRVTPVMGAIAVILILTVMQDPVRGESEGRTHLTATSWSSDVKNLTKNASFMLSTAGFTCVAFVAGALAWWGPNFLLNGLKLQQGHQNDEIKDISYKFGVITMISGLLGVPCGSYLAQRARARWPRADPLICAMGLLVSAPFLFIASLLASVNTNLCYTMIFFGEFFLNLNWSIVADMLLYVVEPTRRSTAEAFQILISHAFGDAGSPYLVGLLSEIFKHYMTGSATLTIPFPSVTSSHNATLGHDLIIPPSDVPPRIEFYSLQYALFTTSFVEVLGGGFFLITSLYIEQDRQNASRELEEKNIEVKVGLMANGLKLTDHR
ncbi:lysolipid transporter protein spinster isoform X2 [Lycorma delicatula]|uniref:lysolipid transporter protein spinster isoform X2 n=1 Tax=Lycorma delicatula TaxID=130591 RepID=UPI003F516AFA